MTYELKLDDAREEGERKGRAEEQLSSIRSMMNKLGLTAEKAMDVLDIPAEKRSVYLAQL